MDKIKDILSKHLTEFCKVHNTKQAAYPDLHKINDKDFDILHEFCAYLTEALDAKQVKTRK